MPKNPTVFGEVVSESDYFRAIPGCKETYKETMLEAARRLHLIDKWIVVTRFQFANTHAIEYTGDKAQTMWKAWNEKIFNKKKK